jgi:dihydroneopterin aldolase
MEENLSKMKILIEELKVIMNIGVRDEERSYPQEIIINLECECDFTKAIETDKINHTINYKDIYKEILEFCKNNSPRLLEKLGGELMQYLFLKFPLIDAIKIQVFKPVAIPSAKRTGIEIYKTREQIN